MNPAMLQPFLTTALPIMVTILLAVWMNGKGFDGVHKRLDDMRADMDRRVDSIEGRLERIETKLDGHETRSVRLEERTSPFAGVR
jgi:tetrahydromethanopterin S-methyltransferase subunit G